MVAARATVTLTTAVVVALSPRLVLEDGCRRMPWILTWVFVPLPV